MKTLTFLLSCLVMFLFASDASAQRSLPSKGASGPFAAVPVEQGPAGDIQIVSLQGVNYDLSPKWFNHDVLIYDKTTGQAWFVYNMGVMYGSVGYPLHSPLPQYECVVSVPPSPGNPSGFAPGLELTASKIDDNFADDLIGVNAAGQIFRYLRRGGPGC